MISFSQYHLGGSRNDGNFHEYWNDLNLKPKGYCRAGASRRAFSAEGISSSAT